MSKKNAPDLTSLVSTKGTATPTQMPTRASVQPAMPVSTSSDQKKSADKNTAPLNFRVPTEFRKRFKQLALDKDMNQTELLFAMFEAFHSQVVSQRAKI